MTSQELSIDEAVDLGLRHHQAGDLEQAENIYRQVLQAEPGHADALHYLGVIAHQTGDSETAVDLIQQAIGHAPQAAPYYSNLGEAQRALGRLDEAAQAYRRALEIDPSFAMAHNNLGNVLADAGRSEEALNSYEKASALMPDDPEVGLNRANLLVELGHVSQAIPEFQRLLDAYPQHATIWNAFGLALESAELLEEALSAFQSAIDRASDFDEARVNGERLRWELLQSQLQRADYERDQENWDAAAAAYGQILNDHPDQVAAHFGLGISHRGRGRIDDAVLSLDRAIRIQPFNQEALAALGQLLIADPDDRFGVETFDEQHRPAIWTALAVAHFQAERFAQAEHAAEQAIVGLTAALTRDREDNGAWTLLGHALRSIRDVERSERILRERLQELGL